MTEDGSPYDNAIAERINGILKDEFGLDEVFEDYKQLKLQVAQSVNLYNNKRPHESNYLLTPHQMHKQNPYKTTSQPFLGLVRQNLIPLHGESQFKIAG